MAVYYDLTIFGNDDVTPILGSVDANGNVTESSFSTDPGHPRPYLFVPEHMGEQEVDFVEGSAIIGQLNFKVLDKRVDPNDQNSGIVTSLLASAGQTAIIGKRALLTMRTSKKNLKTVNPSFELGTFSGWTTYNNRPEQVTVTRQIIDDPTAPNGGKVLRLDIVTDVLPGATLAGGFGQVAASDGGTAPFLYKAGITYESEWWIKAPPGVSVIMTHTNAGPWLDVVNHTPDGTWQHYKSRRPPQAVDASDRRHIGFRETSGDGTFTVYVDDFRMTSDDPADMLQTTVLDGVMASVELGQDLVTYEFTTKDFRERERAGRMFPSAALRNDDGDIIQAPCVFPRGVLAGWGTGAHDAWNPNPIKLLPAVKPAVGVYDAARKQIRWPSGQYFRENLKYDQILTKKMWSAGDAHIVHNSTGSWGGFVADNVSVLWRPVGTTIWNEVPMNRAFSSPEHWDSNLFEFDEDAKYRGNECMGLRGVKVDPINGEAVPASGQTVEFVVVYTGPPNEDYPCVFEGTAGEILKNACDAKYSDSTQQALKVLYNETVMDDLVASTPLIHGLVEEPVDNRMEWLQDNIYKPFGLAPALDQNSRLAPVKSEMPDPSVVLVQLDDTNTDPETAWAHDGEDAITRVHFKFQGDELLLTRDPFMERSNGIGLAHVELEKVFISGSEGELGERTVEIEPVTIRDWFMVDIPLGWFEVGGRAFSRVLGRAQTIFNRFRYGLQRFELRCHRTDQAVSNLKVGDWVILAHSWLPDYVSQSRGANRIGQIAAIKDIDPVWRELVVEDAGPEGQPLAAPVLGVATVDAEGAVTIPVTTVPAGTRVRVEYAVVASGSPIPTQSSNLWMPGGFVDASGGTIKTNILPGKRTVRVRARSEAEGARPSAWVTHTGVTLPTRPAVLEFRLEQDPATGQVRARWTANEDTGSVWLWPAPHENYIDPVFATSLARPAADGEYLFPLSQTNVGLDTLSVRIEPRTGGGGSGVAGKQGIRRIALLHPDGISINPILDQDGLVVNLIPNRSQLAKSVKYAYSNVGPISITTLRSSGIVSTATSIAIPAFTGVLDQVLYVSVIPYANADGTGPEGEMWTGQIRFTSGEPPTITPMPIAPTVATAERVRFVVTHDGTTVAFFHRTYNLGSAAPAYTRTPAAGFAADPQSVEVQVNKPAEGGVQVVIEYYAIDSLGNMTSPRQIRVDGNAFPSGTFQHTFDDRTGEVWITPISSDLSDTGSWRFRVVRQPIGSSTYEAIQHDDGDANEYKGTAFNAPIKLSEVLTDSSQLNIEGMFYRAASSVAATQNGSRKSSAQRFSVALGRITGIGVEITAGLQADDHVLEATVNSLSIGATSWSCWAKIGSIPTLDGTINSRPDNAFLVIPQFPEGERNFKMNVDTGHWYFIFQAFDTAGLGGPLFLAEVEIDELTGGGDGGAGGDPVDPPPGPGGPTGARLENVSVSVVGANHRISWDHSTGAASGHTVTIKRSINREAAVTMISGRDPEVDGAAHTVAGSGYYEAVYGTCIKGSGGCQWTDFTYTVELWNTALNKKVATYEAVRSDYSTLWGV